MAGENFDKSNRPEIWTVATLKIMIIAAHIRLTVENLPKQNVNLSTQINIEESVKSQLWRKQQTFKLINVILDETQLPRQPQKLFRPTDIRIRPYGTALGPALASGFQVYGTT